MIHSGCSARGLGEQQQAAGFARDGTPRATPPGGPGDGKSGGRTPSPRSRPAASAARSLHQLDGVASFALPRGEAQAPVLRVDADQSLRREVLDERAERLALPAPHVEHHRIGRAAGGDEALQVVERDAQHARGPGFRAEEPEADAGFRYEGDVVRGHERKFSLCRGAQRLHEIFRGICESGGVRGGDTHRACFGEVGEIAGRGLAVGRVVVLEQQRRRTRASSRRGERLPFRDAAAYAAPTRQSSCASSRPVGDEMPVLVSSSVTRVSGSRRGARIPRRACADQRLRHVELAILPLPSRTPPAPDRGRAARTAASIRTSPATLRAIGRGASTEPRWAASASRSVGRPLSQRGQQPALAAAGQSVDHEETVLRRRQHS